MTGCHSKWLPCWIRARMQFACRLRSLTAMPLFPSRMRRCRCRPIPALFICSGRSPFLTHSTLMAPFTPASAASPGSTMNTKSVALFHTQDLYLLQSSRLVEGPFVSNLRGGWMPPSFDSYLFFPLHPAALLSTDISLSLSLTHFSDVTKVICCVLSANASLILCTYSRRWPVSLPANSAIKSWLGQIDALNRWIFLF